MKGGVSAGGDIMSLAPTSNPWQTVGLMSSKEMMHGHGARRHSLLHRLMFSLLLLTPTRPSQGESPRNSAKDSTDGKQILEPPQSISSMKSSDSAQMF
jgi:hypothetical protein